MNWYALIYGAGTITLVYLTYRLYIGNPSTESKLYFSLMGVVSSIWVGSEFFYYTFWGRITVVFYLVKFIGIALAPYAVLMSTLTTPMRNKIMKFKYTPIILLIPPLISIIFVFLSPVNHLFFTGFKEITIVDGHPRYVGIWGPMADYWHVPYSYFCLLVAFFVLLFNIKKSHTKIDRYLLITLFVAVLAPVTMNVLVLFFWDIYPDPTSIAIIFSAGFMDYMLAKYKLFKLPQPTIREASMEKVPEIESGKTYLIKGGGYSLVKRIVESRPTLIIGTKSPKWIKETVGEVAPAIWLSEVDSKDSILPERLEFEIQYTIIEFWRQNPKGMVVLEGLAYIRAFNSLDRILLFLKDIIDVSSQYDGGFMLLGDDLVLLDEERNNIEEMFDEKMNVNDNIRAQQIKRDKKLPENADNMLCVSPENPKKACPYFKDALWIRRGGEFTPDSMRIEVLYEIEKKLGEKKDVLIYKPDEIFIGWKTLKIYSYLKLLADLGEKYGASVHVVGEISRKDIKAILSILS